MTQELKQYLYARCDERISQLAIQEIEARDSFRFDEAYQCIKKKCNIYDLKSVVGNLKTTESF